MVAALARAGAVLAAAGALGAMLVVLAGVRVFAFTLIAPATVAAIGIHAAFRADAGSVIQVVAADQTVTAIELRAVVRGGNTANGAF